MGGCPLAALLRLNLCVLGLTRDIRVGRFGRFGRVGLVGRVGRLRRIRLCLDAGTLVAANLLDDLLDDPLEDVVEDVVEDVIDDHPGVPSWLFRIESLLYPTRSLGLVVSLTRVAYFQFYCRSNMQRVLNIAPLAPVSVSVAPRTRVTRARVAMKVASLDSVASQMDAAGFDKEDAYRRFDELLGTADVSFNQGDRVSTMTELATCAALSSFPPASRAARRLTAHCISNVASDGRMAAQLSPQSPSKLLGSDSPTTPIIHRNDEPNPLTLCPAGIIRR